MSEGAYIRDIQVLEELNNIIAFTGESMANIEENVSNYINGVKDVLNKQLDIIRKELERAKDALSEAQSALSSCESSQSYDEETGEWSPSCDWEAMAVDSAQREVDEWQEKYDEGKGIVDECEKEIDDYNEPGGIMRPPGGHHLIRYMCEEQTKTATDQLQAYIGDVYEYKQQDVGGDLDTAMEVSNPAVKEDDNPLTEEEKSAVFNSNIQSIKNNQEYSSSCYDIQDANRVMHCPNCGMPLQLCTCRNLHVDINLYQ